MKKKRENKRSRRKKKRKNQRRKIRKRSREIKKKKKNKTRMIFHLEKTKAVKFNMIQDLKIFNSYARATFICSTQNILSIGPSRNMAKNIKKL